MKKTNKTKSIYILLTLCLFLTIPLAFGLETLGTFKQNDCVRVPQTCATCTYVNISSISSKESNTTQASNIEMTSFGNGEWYYDFCNTEWIGRYDVRGMGDINGDNTNFAYYFEITPSGFQGTLGFYIILSVILGAIVVLGFSIEEEWFVVIGGLGIIMLGIYSINYGVAGFRDMFMTWGVGLFEIGIGAFLAIGAALQKING